MPFLKMYFKNVLQNSERKEMNISEWKVYTFCAFIPDFVSLLIISL